MAANSNFDNLLSTTLANYRDQLTDNIFTARPLTYTLMEKGRERKYPTRLQRAAEWRS